MTAKKTNPEKKSHVLAWFAILRKRRSKLLTKRAKTKHDGELVQATDGVLGVA